MNNRPYFVPIPNGAIFGDIGQRFFNEKFFEAA
jgi:hypothetical protein